MGDGGLVVFNSKRHEHELHYTEGLGAYKCRGCKGGGGNTGYKCRSCPEFVLHEICTAWSDHEERDHPFFPRDPFKFRSRTRLRHDCDACGGLIRGFLFQSREGRTLHPLCLTLPLHFRHSGHAEHVFRLITDQERGKYSCTHCRKENTNWKYRCSELACPSTLDMNCAIIHMYDLYPHGISQVYKPSKTQRALRMVATAGTVVCTSLLEVAGSAVINREVDHGQGD